MTQRTVLVSALDADKNFGSADPAFDYTYTTGMVGGTIYYAPLAGDLSGISVTVHRTNSDNNVGLYPDVLEANVVATPAVLENYAFTTAPADFTVNPQVVYNLNTTDAVTGFPETTWFDLGTDALVASANGVKRLGYHITGWEDAVTGEPIALGATIPAIDRNRTLDAVWDIALYNVYYVKGTDKPVVDMPDNDGRYPVRRTGNDFEHGSV